MKADTHPDYHLINVKMTDGTIGPDEIDLGRRRGDPLALGYRPFRCHPGHGTGGQHLA